MKIIKDYTHKLNQFLQQLRHHLIGEKLAEITLIFTIIFPVYFLLTLLLENTFYLPSSLRQYLWYSYPAFGILYIGIMAITAMIINFGWTRNYTVKGITKKFAVLDEKTANKFLDSIQLLTDIRNSDTGYSGELILASVENTINELNKISVKDIVRKCKLKKQLIHTAIILTASGMLFLLNSGQAINALGRLKNYNRHYKVPLPFTIESRSGDMEIFSGDTVNIQVQTVGKHPGELKITLDYEDYQSEKYFEIDSAGQGEFPVNAITKNFTYEISKTNHSVFKPWKKISSGVYHVNVNDRPEILNITTKINFPAYTGIGEKVKESNNSEFFAMPGSKISVRAQLNKPVSKASLQFKDRAKLPLSIQHNALHGEFSVKSAEEYFFKLRDANGISNINPIKYKVKITPDNYPSATLLSPREDFQLNEQMQIPVLLRISDDYGFTKAVIHYKLLKKFSERNDQEFTVDFPLKNKQVTFQEVAYEWDVSGLGLAPEDGVEFFIEIFDNDTVMGPKKTTTGKVSAFFPSLNDMFSQVDKNQEEVQDTGEDILDKLHSSKEVLQDISNKLLKDPKLSWEQKEQLQQEIDKTKEAGEDLKKLSEKIKEIQKQGEDNQLFSEETIKKYAELQQSMQEIMTPELQKAMEELQKAIKQADQENTQKSMDKFKTSHDKFSKELDRMLKLMKRVKIEQSVDELAKRIEDITNRQDSVSANLDNRELSENKDWNALQKEERNIERDTEIFEDILQKTAQEMQDFPIMNQKELENIQQKLHEKGIYDDMRQAQKSMQMRDQQQSSENSRQAHQKLSEMRQDMQSFQQDFQQKNMQEITEDFQNAIMKSLQLSQTQETINKEIQAAYRQSDQFSQIALKQNRNYQNISKLISDLNELSNKTFGLSGESTKSIGRAANQMQKAMARMTERNPSSSGTYGKRAKAALNQLSMDLMNSMSKLQQSGESSGFENYMQQMEKLAKQQQGLNQETQQRGPGMPKPMPGGKQPGSLRQLAARQRQIQESLQQLQEEVNRQSTQQTGNLKGIAKDMEDVIKDLNQNKVLRKTIDRQQKILTRMLDAQQSLRTQSYKKERESKSGEGIVGTSPGALPEDLGERNLLLTKKLEEALQNGYSNEYKEIIRKYFEELAKEENKTDE